MNLKNALIAGLACVVVSGTAATVPSAGAATSPSTVHATAGGAEPQLGEAGTPYRTGLRRDTTLGPIQGLATPRTKTYSWLGVPFGGIL